MLNRRDMMQHSAVVTGLLASAGMLNRTETLSVIGPPSIGRFIDCVLETTELRLPYPLQFISVEALAEFVDSLRGPAVPVLLARVKDRPRDALEHAGLLTNEQIALYWSVDDAVNAARRLTEPAAESSPGHH